MFTGIVQGMGEVVEARHEGGLLRFSVAFPPELVVDLKLGASVAINGCCLTVTSIDETKIFFDIMQETLEKTTFPKLSVGNEVNIERSMKMGDEIGGHIVSGHVHGVGTVKEMVENIISLETSPDISKYIFSKGFISLNGVSLTVVEVLPTTDNRQPTTFSVSLIPETLRRTNFNSIKVGNELNIEVDQQTKTTVDTLEKLHTSK